MGLPASSIGEYGQVVGFGLHDAGLIGLAFDDGAGQLTVRLRRVDGRVAMVSLHGVGYVGFVGLRNGAIVSDLFVWAPAGARLDAGPMPRTAWEVVFGNDLPVEDLPKAVGPIVEEGEFNHLVLMECSYGGAMAALCREIDVKVCS